jgi:hypothetical protein
MISKVAAVALAMCHAASASIGEYWKQLSTPVYEVEGWSVKDATMARGEDGTYAVFYSGFYTAPRDEYASCWMHDALNAEFRDFRPYALFSDEKPTSKLLNKLQLTGHFTFGCIV